MKGAVANKPASPVQTAGPVSAMAAWRSLVFKSTDQPVDLNDPFGFRRSNLANDFLLAKGDAYEAAAVELLAAGAAPDMVNAGRAMFRRGDTANATHYLENAAVGTIHGRRPISHD